MKEVLQVAYLRHLQDFYLVESVKDGSIAEKTGGSNADAFFRLTGISGHLVPLKTLVYRRNP